MKKRSVTRVEKPDAVNWKAPTTGATGCEELVSMDGMIMLRKQDRCMGTSVPMRYQVWEWKKGMWRKVFENRSCQRAEEFSARLSEKLSTAE